MKLATAVIVFQDDKILIAQRTKDLLWEFPGGKIDPGETPSECAVREMKEELNIDIRIDRSLGFLEGVYRGIPMRVYGFISAWVGGNLERRVHLDVKWVKHEELEAYRIVEEDREILKKFL